MKKLILIAALAAAPVFAHADAAEDAIEARHGFYKMLAINMGTLAGMAQGEVPYDEEQAAVAGANIEALTGYDLPGLFIEGTSSEDNPESAALPAIWENPEGFAERYAGLQQAAVGASEAVMGGQENVGPVVQKLGAACKACHDDFRKK